MAEGTVLVVDDEKEIRDLIDILTSLFFTGPLSCIIDCANYSLEFSRKSSGELQRQISVLNHVF